MSVGTLANTSTYAPYGAPVAPPPTAQAFADSSPNAAAGPTAAPTTPTQSPPTASVSRMLAQVRQLQESSPAKYQDALSAVATTIQSAAATAGTNSTQLEAMASRLSQAAASGDISVVTGSMTTSVQSTSDAATVVSAAKAAYAHAPMPLANTAGGDISDVLSDTFQKSSDALAQAIAGASPTVGQQTATGGTWMAAAAATNANTGSGGAGSNEIPSSDAVTGVVETTA